MNKTANRIITLMLCLIGVQLQCVAFEAPSTGKESNCHIPARQSNIGHTSDDLPQWEDFGMENVLVVGSQPTVTAPVSVRPAHENGSVCGRNADAMHRFQHPASERSVLPHRALAGYIYHLLCLRL